MSNRLTCTIGRRANHSIKENGKQILTQLKVRILYTGASAKLNNLVRTYCKWKQGHATERATLLNSYISPLGVTGLGRCKMGNQTSVIVNMKNTMSNNQDIFKRVMPW